MNGDAETDAKEYEEYSKQPAADNNGHRYTFRSPVQR